MKDLDPGRQNLLRQLDRRDFLRLALATGGTLFLGGCQRPPEGSAIPPSPFTQPAIVTPTTPQSTSKPIVEPTKASPNSSQESKESKAEDNKNILESMKDYIPMLLGGTQISPYPDEKGPYQHTLISNVVESHSQGSNEAYEFIWGYMRPADSNKYSGNLTIYERTIGKGEIKNIEPKIMGARPLTPADKANGIVKLLDIEIGFGFRTILGKLWIEENGNIWPTNTSSFWADLENKVGFPNPKSFSLPTTFQNGNLNFFYAEFENGDVRLIFAKPGKRIVFPVNYDVAAEDCAPRGKVVSDCKPIIIKSFLSGQPERQPTHAPTSAPAAPTPARRK